MRADLWLTRPQHPRAAGLEMIPRGKDILYLIADMVDAARGVLFQKPKDGRVFAKRMQKLDLRIGQLDEDHRDAVIRFRLRRADLGTKGTAVLGGGGLKVRDGNGDVVQAADHAAGSVHQVLGAVMGMARRPCKGQPVAVLWGAVLWGAVILTGRLPAGAMLHRLPEDAMPFPPDAPTSPQAHDAVDALPLRGLTLLAVEDSRFACDALRLICIRSGARLRRAETLAAARSYLVAHRPDVVIVDLGLPDGRGEELIADLARIGLPVLATSGDPEGRPLALSAGAVAFLDKPIGSIGAFQGLVLNLVGCGDTRPRTETAAQSTPPADELAFRDDLAHAAALISGADIGYAMGFLRSLGRSAGDHALEAAALAAATSPGHDALARLVAARLARPQRVS